MMIEREDGPPPSGKARFPLLWEEETDSEGVALWRHVVTGGVQSTPLPSLRGGILADVSYPLKPPSGPNFMTTAPLSLLKVSPSN